MKRHIVRVSKSFDRDLSEVCDWYNEREPGLGDRLRDDALQLLLRIAERPLSYPVWREPVRRALVSEFDHLVAFVVESKQVYVLGLVHGMRDLDRWLGRRWDEAE